MTRPLRLLARAALAAAATLVALLLAEGALRAYFWSRGVGRTDLQELLQRSQQADISEVTGRGVYGIVQPSLYPDIVYELKPNMAGVFRGQPIRTNAFGMRGKDLTRRKPPGVRRIVGIGDSHMFGWAVAQGETYLEVLEERLNREAAGPWRYEVLNFAAPGYNTAMEVAMYEHRARDFEPDLVVIHFVGNDLALPYLLQTGRGAAPSDWYLAEMVRSVLGGGGATERIELARHGLPEHPREVREELKDEYRWMLGEEGYRRAMARLARLTREDGVPVIVLFMGNRTLARETAAEHGLRPLNAAEFFVARLRQEGIEVTRKNFRRQFNILSEGHPSALAQVAFADALYAELEAVGFLSVN